MTLFCRTQSIGRTAVAVAIFAAGAAASSPVRAADDLPIVGDIRIEMPRVLEDQAPPPRVYESAPYERPYAQRSYRPGPYAPGPYAGVPSGGYNRALPGARPLLPPSQVAYFLRSSGYSLLGPVTQRGWVYTVAALDQNGDDGRLIVDARTGRVVRFVPAMAVDERFNDRMAMVYGPPGSPPSDMRYGTRRGSLLDLRRAPRPAVAVPNVTPRNAPKVASRLAPIPAARPAAAPPAAAPPVQQATPAQTPAPEPVTTTAESAPPSSFTVGRAKPEAVVIQPATPNTPPAVANSQPAVNLPAVQPLD